MNSFNDTHSNSGSKFKQSSEYLPPQPVPIPQAVLPLIETNVLLVPFKTAGKVSQIVAGSHSYLHKTDDWLQIGGDVKLPCEGECLVMVLRTLSDH